MAKTQTQSGPVDLFGNSRLSPRQVMQQQLSQLLQETATRTASADPRTQGVSMMGSAVGGLLGDALIKAGVLPKPPEMERAERLEKARTALNEDVTRLGLDPVKDPDAFADRAATHLLNAGDEQGASMALQWKELQAAKKRVAEKEKQSIATARSQEVQNLKDYTPASIEEFRTTNDASKLVMDPEAVKKGRSSYLVPVDSAQHGKIKFDTRSGNYYTNDGKPIAGRIDAPKYDPDTQRRVAEGKESGKKTAGAKFDLPTAEANADRVLKTIDDALADPSLKNVTGGFAGRLPALFGQQARGVARVEQLKGGAFLAAYQELKGGGHITEIEGEKATQAIARLNRTQDYKDFISALRDLRAVIKRGRDVARQKAGKAPTASPASATGGAPAREPGGLPPGWELVQ